MKKLLFILAIASFWGQIILAQNMSDKQKSVIYNEAIKTLQTYQSFINQMADESVDLTAVNKTSEKLIDLFVARKAIIFNDLDPTHKLSEFYELETYVSNLMLWYPDGMKIVLDFDNLKAGNIMAHENDVFTVDLMTTKKIKGNYLNQTKNTNSEELLYRIAFFKNGATYENYKIAGIRSRTSKKVDDSRTIAEVKSAGFDEKDMGKVKEQAKGVLRDYINYLNLLVDPKEAADDKEFYKTSFTGVFKDEKIKITNDIEPEPQQRWLPVSEYIQRYMQSYPEGIRNLGLNIDSAEYGKVITEGKEKFSLHIYADKFFSGKYKEKTVFRDNSRLDIKFVFERDENTFKNFKVESIDKFGGNFYAQTATTPAAGTNGTAAAPTVDELPQIKIEPIKRKGIYWGLTASTDLTSMSNSNLTQDNSLGWKVSGQMGIKAGLSLKYYPFNQLGIESGIWYNQYNAKASLSGTYTSTTTSLDLNDESSYKNIVAAFDSSVSINYISIPISLIFHSNKKIDKIGFFAKAGIIASFVTSSKYKASGSIKSYGYYPNETNKNLQINEDPALGYYNRSNIDASGKAEIKNSQYSFITSIGVSVPLKYYTNFEFGPEIVVGLSGISSQSEFTNAFSVKTPIKNVIISKYGFKFGINHKF